MANIAALKGVRTRFRKNLVREIGDANTLISGDYQVSEIICVLSSANKLSKIIKCYSEKVESQMYKVSDAVGDSDSTLVENIVEEDCQLLQEAEQCLVELEQLTEDLKSKKDEENVSDKSKDVTPESAQIIELQEQMQSLISTQMDNHMELMSRQDEKEKEKKSSVKLPQIDLCVFNGDKLKWTQFWDAFEATIHTNKKLSQIEKFNYLQTKVSGEAKRAIDGLTLSNDNYCVAVAILRDRFGDPQEAVDLHYRKLINVQTPTSKVESLRSFLDTIERHIRSLEVLKENVNQHVVISMIKSKLPGEVIRQLELNHGSKSKWTVQTLLEQIREYVLACEKAETNDSKDKSTHTQKNEFAKRIQTKQPVKSPISTFKGTSSYAHSTSSSEALTVHAKGKPSDNYKMCRYCNDRHWSDEYKTAEERKKMLRGSCYKCLKEGHKSPECKSKKICVHCGELDNHHRSLCPKKFRKKTHVYYSKDSSESVSQQDSALVATDEMVLMQTARTDVRGENSGHCESARILLDSGSQRTYISECLSKKLGLKVESEQELRLVTFGSDNAQVIKTKTVKVGVKLKDDSVITISANVVPTISGAIQRNSVKNVLTNQMKQIVNSVVLADTVPSTQECSSIDLLIGNDYYLDIVLPQRIELGPGLYLLNSRLGWILTGRTSVSDSGSEQVSMFVMTHGTDVTKQCAFSNIDTSIQTKPDLEDFWNVESIGITDDSAKTSDEVAMEKFKDTVTFKDGRYEVTWPWRDEDPELPTNKQLSLGRLKSTVSRLNKNPELMQKYNDVIEDQLNKRVIEKVDGSRVIGPIHYIPHHPVISPQKTTTKLRLVYDASAKSRQENKSLNECLYRGPVILQHICGVLLRFRMHTVAIVADIEKAFLQIGLRPGQRDVTRFLWLKDRATPTANMNNIQEYRFCRVPFGIISSPFLLGATVQHHMDSFNNEVAEQVKRDIYVDNLITGATSDADAIRFYQTVKPMFQSASMNLREWITNSEVVNTYIPAEDRAGPETMTVLGLCWNPTEDTLSLKQTDTSECDSTTKRSILKKVASSFDPLGLFSPIILRGKILIQHLWSMKLNWDDEVEQNEELEWKTINSDLELLAEHNVQRCVTCDSDQEVTSSLVCFCDASEKAYAAVIYLHQTSLRGTKVELLFSKSRLAPLKTMTIPRLEIMAVVIGVRCIEFVHQQLTTPIQNSYVYTDSQCVLKWISSEKDLPVFVKNRVNEIKKHKDIEFSYVKTNENPADVATRGTTFKRLSEDSLWWHGPSWLLQSGSNSKVKDEVTQDTQEECPSSVCQCTELEKERSCEIATASAEQRAIEREGAPFEIDKEDCNMRS